MFKPKKDNTYPVETQTRAAVDTIIGEQCTIRGDLSSPQSVKIDGNIEGNITAKGCVIIGEKAVIKGDVDCSEVVLYGHLEGNITAKTTQLKNTSKIHGNISTGSLQVEPGAVYQGSIEMNADGSVVAKALEIQDTFSLPEK